MNKVNWQRLLALSFVVLFWAVVIGALAGCARASDPRDGTNAPGDTSPGPEDTFSDRGAGVVTDNETGCQYVTMYGKGITPRMSRYEDGKQRQMGCIEQIHMTNPMEGLDK